MTSPQAQFVILTNESSVTVSTGYKLEIAILMHVHFTLLMKISGKA